MRVVASLTTIPGRYQKLLRTLQSLRAQDYPLDAIYLGIPRESRRLKQSYPELPSEITDLCTVVPCEDDYGPCTKIVGALLRENNPNTVILTFDDDIIYSPNLVSTMLAYHNKYPNMAIGSSGILLKYGFPFYSTISNCAGNWNILTGFQLNEEGRAVDVLCGFSSVLYVRRFFPRKRQLKDKFLKYPLMDPDVYFNDDIMISAFLSRRGIERRIFPSIPVTNERKVYDPKIDGNEISYDKIAFVQRLRRAINKVQEWGLFTEAQSVALDETIGGHVLIILVLILVLVAAIWLLWASIPPI